MISFVPVKIESRSNLTLGFKAIVGAGLCALTVVGLLASDSFADSRSTRSKARAIIKEHKANLKALRRLKLSPAAFAAISGASTLRDSDSDGVPDIYEEAQSTYKSCDADSDDDGTEDGDESSSSSSSSSSGSSSSSSSGSGSSSSSSSSDD